MATKRKTPKGSSVDGSSIGVTGGRSPGYISVAMVVLISMGITVVATFGEFAVGILGPSLKRDLGVEPAQLGVFVAIMFLGSALAAMPSGIIADRVDPRKLVLGQVILAAIAFGTFAIVLNPEHLFISVAAIGVVMSMNAPMTNRMVIDFVPLKHRSSAIAWKSVGLQVSALLTGLAFGLTESFADWRTTVTVIAALMVAFGIAAHLRFRRADPLRPSFAATTIESPKIDPLGDAVPVTTGEISTIQITNEAAKKERIAEPIVWWLIPFSLLSIGSFTAVAAYMVLYGTTEAGVSPAAAANASGIAAGISIFARFLWVRWLTDRNEVFVLGAVSVTSAAAVVLLAISPMFGPVGFWIAAITIGLTILASTPVQQVVMLRNTNPRYIGRVSSIVGVAISTSLAGMPFAVSLFIDSIGLYTTWMLVAGVTALGAVTMVIFAVTRAVAAKREKADAAQV